MKKGITSLIVAAIGITGGAGVASAASDNPSTIVPQSNVQTINSGVFYSQSVTGKNGVGEVNLYSRGNSGAYQTVVNTFKPNNAQLISVKGYQRSLGDGSRSANVTYILKRASDDAVLAEVTPTIGNYVSQPFYVTFPKKIAQDNSGVVMYLEARNNDSGAWAKVDVSVYWNYN
ncbi:hypothetical protein CHH79_17940 [Bacillus siamensis]|uniref:hypothetical protein n=1 Tax=Bacillus siamensis TaxID=659243 RepID=UPI000647E383|nr:hypothetical protein [Bacillus siamensis]PAD62433.1 hypothetical protein CHH79_17940 [Bacillus siamensis]